MAKIRYFYTINLNTQLRIIYIMLNNVWAGVDQGKEISLFLQVDDLRNRQCRNVSKLVVLPLA